MKRWNQPGTVHAKRRMAELRHAKKRHLVSDLITVWQIATGRPRAEWWAAAQAAGLKSGCGHDATIAFLKADIAKASPVAATEGR